MKTKAPSARPPSECCKRTASCRRSECCKGIPQSLQASPSTLFLPACTGDGRIPKTLVVPNLLRVWRSQAATHHSPHDRGIGLVCVFLLFLYREQYSEVGPPPLKTVGFNLPQALTPPERYTSQEKNGEFRTERQGKNKPCVRKRVGASPGKEKHDWRYSHMTGGTHA